MTTPTDIERISYGGPKGSLQLGKHRQVIQGVGATRTLLASESGSLCLFDSAAGVVYTLPTPVEGMTFDFHVAVTRTSNAHKVKTAVVASQFLLGAVMSGDATIATSGDVFTANGTTIAAITCDGDTKGGFIGEHYTVTAISATQWAINGLVIGTGTMVDPFTTT
jgi:hypothetical protein